MSNSTRGSRIPWIPGSKPSIKNAQLLVSTGVPSLDEILGGGLPIGTVLLIEEDTYGNYSKIMLEYFLAEGVVSSHMLFIASQDIRPDQIVSELPAVVTNPTTNHETQSMHETMHIAWRYQNMKILDTENYYGVGHYFDLTKTMDKEMINATKITTWNGDNIQWNHARFKNPAYADLLKEIQETLKKHDFYVSANPDKRNILRIVLHSLGSRMWLSDDRDSSQSDLTMFLYFFRALLRHSYAVSVISVPTQNFETQDCIVGRIEHTVDTAISLEGFAGSNKETNPIFKDYHGLLHIKKLSAINTLAAPNPKSFDLAFKLRRKKFVIEVLHLPPEFTDSQQREQDDMPITAACGSASKVMDF